MSQDDEILAIAREGFLDEARDMLRHYVTNILPNGFKAQVVAYSRLAVVRYLDAFEVARDELLAESQALSPEEKRKLAAGAPTRPSGAAPALKPVPATKLATTPNANPPRGGASGTSLAAARAASAPRQIDQKTLLPRKVASAP